MKNRDQRIPFFSIIIPVLNEQKLLPLLLNDLIKQSFTQFELIIVDGGSKDLTKQRCLKLFERFSQASMTTNFFESSESNVGAQRNLGASYASGEYLLFLDADNRLPQYFLEGIHYNLMKNTTDLFTCYSFTTDKSRSSQLYMQVQNQIIELGKSIQSIFILGACIGCKRSVFQQSTGFDSSIRYMEDREFVQRLVENGCSFDIYEDPQFEYSLRRQKKDGLLRHIARLIPHWTDHLLLGKKMTEPLDAYPMNGGTYFEEKKTLTPQSEAWLDQITRFFDDLLGEDKVKVGETFKNLKTPKKK